MRQTRRAKKRKLAAVWPLLAHMATNGRSAHGDLYVANRIRIKPQGSWVENSWGNERQFKRMEPERKEKIVATDLWADKIQVGGGMNITLLIIAGILAIANLNLWAVNLIDRGVDRQIELRRLVMKEQRTGAVYECYAVKAASNRRKK